MAGSGKVPDARSRQVKKRCDQTKRKEDRSGKALRMFSNAFHPCSNTKVTSGDDRGDGDDNDLLRGYSGDNKRFLIGVQQKLRIFLLVVNAFPDPAEFERTIHEKFNEAREDMIALKGKQFMESVHSQQ